MELSMKKMIGILTVIGVSMVLAGCAGFQGPQNGGVGLGLLAGDTTYPGGILTTTRIAIDADDFDIMQTITAESFSESILGLVSSGDSGYGTLFAKAKSIGADDVINIKIYTNQKRYIGGLYTKSTTMLTGTAIRWKK